MGVTIRLALAALALALAVLGPMAAQAVTVTWATHASWSGAGSADAALGAPDARSGRSGLLALGPGGVALFDFGGAFSGSAFVREAGLPFSRWSRRLGRTTADVYVSMDRLDSAVFKSFVKVGDVGGLRAPLDTRIELPDGLYRTLAIVDTSRSWRSGGYRVDAVGVSQVAAIPLPMTAAMMAAGLAGLAFVGRRRRRAAAKADA